MEKGRFIRSIQLKNEQIEDYSKYPFFLEAVKKLEKTEFCKQVTFIFQKPGQIPSALAEKL
jgi:predicted ATPase